MFNYFQYKVKRFSVSLKISRGMETLPQNARTIPFPCQFRQNEIELCQDENQDRVNEFQFRFREKSFCPYETEFC